MYLVGRRATEELIHKSGTNSAGDPREDLILNNIIAQQGIEGDVPSNYHVYYLSNDSVDAIRLLSNDDFTLVWSDVDHGSEGILREIVGVDFSIEDNRRLIKFLALDPDTGVDKKDECLANGVDSILIKCVACDPSDETLETIDTSFEGELNVPFIDPDRRRGFAKVVFTQGIGEKLFKTTKYGEWHIPNRYKYSLEKNAKNFPGASYDINALLDL